MHLATLVEMVESGFGERVLLVDGERRLSGTEFVDLVRRGAATLGDGPSSLVYVGENHPLLPVALFAAAVIGIPFVPVNYRLQDEQLRALVARQEGAMVLADPATAPRLDSFEATVFDDWLAALPAEADPVEPAWDDDAVAVVLYTSGTTSEPKSALLRHRHLMAYLLGSVEFGGAEEGEAVLVAVPPYHVAGVANMLSNTFAGRRLVYLSRFDPKEWLEVIRTEGITNAMVVPTMLARIVEALDGAPADVPTLRSLSYGGSKMPERILLEALRLFPDTGFVNAYGLTETASTIAVLGPEDHRLALDSGDADVRRRLGSAGQVLPAVEVEVRDVLGQPLDRGEVGMIYLRGEQISGEYASGSLLDGDGWFCTRDQGWVDAEGYLFIEGRADDTIIRGGENIAPAEIEAVLATIPEILDACVVGLPDDEWGQRIAAAIVVRPGVELTGDDVRERVRSELRGSKTPELVVFREELPYTETGKLLRRVVQDELTAGV